MTELEIIRHARVGGISIFFDSVEYRTAHFHSLERFYSKEESEHLLQAL